MKNLLPACCGLMLICGCIPELPLLDQKFTVTIDGEKFTLDHIQATLYNDYLYIETFGDVELGLDIYLHESLPLIIDESHYTYLETFNPFLYKTGVNGGEGIMTSLIIDMERQEASGAFESILAYFLEDSDEIVLNASFEHVFFLISAPSYQPFGEISFKKDDELLKGHVVYQFNYDSISNETVLYANILGVYGLTIRHIPFIPGVYALDTGAYYYAEGPTVQLQEFSDYVYNFVQPGGTLEVVSYDPASRKLIINYNFELNDGSGHSTKIDEGYAMFYAGEKN